LTTDGTVKIWISKKAKLNDGVRVEYGAEATVPKTDIATGLMELKGQFEMLVAPMPAPTNQPVTAASSTTTSGPTPTSTMPSQPAGYNGLPWKQSEKRRELATILVTPELPLPAKELYDALSKAANLTLKLNDATYRLSKTDTAEFLQRWTKATK